MKIVHQDPRIAVVDKPAGMAAHPAQGVEGPTLLDEIRFRWKDAILLHRLDREASGLVLVVIDPAAAPALQAQLEKHEIDRVYVALLAGALREERVVDRPVPERAQGRAALRRPPPPDARPARTRFVPIATDKNVTRVRAILETGRKHQIRVHAASIGHPLVGDRRYGGPPASRLMLHATRLQIGELVVESPPPF